MADIADDVAELAAGASRVSAMLGTYVGFVDGLPTVDVGGGRIPVATFAPISCAVNDAVHVWFVNGKPFLMGPSSPRPGFGTVTAVAGGLVTVSTDAGVFELPFYAGYGATPGDVVKIDWSYPAAVAWVLSAVPDELVPPPAPGGGGGVQVQVFTAVDAGTQNRSGSSGWWSSQVWASNTTRGMWWYGSKIPDTIPASASVLSVEVFVSAAQIFGAAPNFALHAYRSKPSGFAGFAGAREAVPVSPGWVELPPSFRNGLKAGGGAFGVGCDTGGFNKFNSLAADPMSGALRIRYTV